MAKKFEAYGIGGDERCDSYIPTDGAGGLRDNGLRCRRCGLPAGRHKLIPAGLGDAMDRKVMPCH